MTDQNIWKFDYNPNDYRGRRVTGTYRALVDHAATLGDSEIENFDFDKLDDSIRLPIMYAVMLHNDWKNLGQDHQPTFEEFRTALDHPDFGTKGWYAGMEKPELLGFSPKPIPAVKTPNIPGFSPNVGKAVGILNDGLNYLGMDTDAVRQRAVSKMKERIKTAFRSRVGNRVYETVSGKQGDDDGNTKTNYSGGTVVNPTGLSLNNKPVRVSFTTGIEIGGEPKFYLDGKEETSPLIMKTGLPGVVSGTADDTNLYHDPQVYAWLSGPITNTWITKLQSKLVWTNQIRDIITNSNVVKYFNYLITSLYIYFFYTSVIAYTSDSRNRNAGLYQIRQAMTASDFVELSLLKLNLEQSLIPPFIMKMCHYFSGNFKQSMDPGSPLIKLFPWEMVKIGDTNQFSGVAPQLTFPDGNSYSMLEYGNRLMRDSTVRDITAVLARSYPTWMGQEPLGYESLPEHDPDFTTMFNNMTYTTMSSGHAVEHLPEVASADDIICFNTYSDAPDGWITAMLSIRDTSAGGKQGPGLLNPVLPRTDSNDLVTIISEHGTQGKSTEFVYASNGNTTGWWPSSIDRDFLGLICNTYEAGYTGTGSTKFQKFGTGRLNFVNRQIIIPRVLQMLELIYISDLDDMVNPTSEGGRKGGGMSKRSGGKRKGKSRGRKNNAKDKFEEKKVEVKKETKDLDW